MFKHIKLKDAEKRKDKLQDYLVKLEANSTVRATAYFEQFLELPKVRLKLTFLERRGVMGQLLRWNGWSERFNLERTIKTDSRYDQEQDHQED